MKKNLFLLLVLVVSANVVVGMDNQEDPWRNYAANNIDARNKQLQGIAPRGVEALNENQRRAIAAQEARMLAALAAPAARAEAVVAARMAVAEIEAEKARSKGCCSIQ